MDASGNLYVAHGYNRAPNTVQVIVPNTAVCQAGSYVAAGPSCAYCPAGTYNPSVTPDGSLLACAVCPRGQSSGTAGATSSTTCTNCAAGTYADAGSAQCTPCARGTYAYYSSQSSCANCPGGTYAAGTGATVCAYCNEYGTFSGPGASTCTRCPSGTAASSTAASQCEVCSAGLYTNDGRGCYPCDRGYYSGISASACSECAVGTYSDSGGASACTSCPAGSYGPLTKSISCKSCPAGYYADSAGASSCSACPANTYNTVTGSVSSKACIACSGFSISNPGSSACYLVPPTPAPTVRAVSPTLTPTSIPVPLAVVRVKQTIAGLDLAIVSSLPFQNRLFAIQSLITNLPISAFFDFSATAGRRRSLLQSPVTVAYTVSAPNSNPATLSALLSAPATTASLEAQLKATYASIAVLSPSFTNQSPSPAPTAVATLAPAVVVLRATQSISG